MKIQPNGIILENGFSFDVINDLTKETIFDNENIKYIRINFFKGDLEYGNFLEKLNSILVNLPLHIEIIELNIIPEFSILKKKPKTNIDLSNLPITLKTIFINEDEYVNLKVPFNCELIYTKNIRIEKYEEFSRYFIPIN